MKKSIRYILVFFNVSFFFIEICHTINYTEQFVEIFHLKKSLSCKKFIWMYYSVEVTMKSINLFLEIYTILLEDRQECRCQLFICSTHYAALV